MKSRLHGGCSINYMIYLLHSALAGTIIPGAVNADYLNAGLLSSLSFEFLLATDLRTTDYIQATLPFPLHTALTAAFANENNGYSSPHALDCQYTSGPASGVCLVLTASISSSVYYIKFLAGGVTPQNISSSLFHKVTLTSYDSAVPALQSSGQIFQMQLASVSGVAPSALIYDQNKAFAYFQLLSLPSSLAASFAYQNILSDPTLPSATYFAYLDLSHSLSSTYTSQGLAFHIYSSSPGFGLGSCTSIANSALGTPAISPAAYTCSPFSQNGLNKLKLEVSGSAVVPSFRIRLQVTNPAVTVQGAKLIVAAMLPNTRTVKAYVALNEALVVSQLHTVLHNVKINGFQPDPLLPSQPYLVRSDSTSAESPMNKIEVDFKISASTLATLQLKVVLYLNLESSASISDRSIRHNLPAFPNKAVACVEQFASDPSSRSIACTGVGQLLAGTTYSLSLRAALPYDVFMSNYSTTSFGKLSILPCSTVSARDRSFYVGRSDRLLAQISTQPGVYVIGRDPAFFSYFKTFFAQNIIAAAHDFPTYSGTSGVYFNNRPASAQGAVGLTDFFVVNQNLDFMNYLTQFSDLFFAAAYLPASDLVSGYGSPILSSSPTNAARVDSINSALWGSPQSNVVISSSSGTVSNPTLKGVSTTDNILQIKLPGPLTSVVSTGRILYRWGLQILAPSSVTCSSAAPSVSYLTAVGSPLAATASCQTVSSSSNSYTLIRVTSVNNTGPSQIQNNLIGLSGVSFSGSEWDIYIAAIDSVFGPTYNQTLNGFYLCHVGLRPSLSSLGLSFSFVNYYNTASGGLTGNSVPTMLRVKGTSSLFTAVSAQLVFSSGLTFYPLNAITRRVYCSSTCTAKTGSAASLSADYTFPSAVSFPLTSTTDVFIFTVLPAGLASTDFYLVYYDAAGNALGAQYSSARPGGYSLQFTPHTGLTFGISTALSTTSFTVNLNYGSALTLNSASQVGSGLSFFAPFDYLQGGTATIAGWSQGTCQYLQYASTSSSLQYYYGTFCDYLSGTVSSVTLTLTNTVLPTKWGKLLPAFAAYSNQGVLAAISSNNNPSAAVTTITTVTPPVLGSSMVMGTIGWSIVLPVPLNYDTQVVLQSTSFPLTYNSLLGGCQAYNDWQLLSRVACSLTFSSTTITFTLTIPEVIAAGTNLTLLVYGVSTSVPASFTHSISIYSLANTLTVGANDLVCSTTSVPVTPNPVGYAGPSALTTSGLYFNVGYKQAVSAFGFSLTLTNHPLRKGQSLTVNLGELQTDNANRGSFTFCRATAAGFPLYWVDTFDYSALTAVTITPKYNSYNTSLVLNIDCSNFVVPSSNSPTPVIASLLASDQSTLLSATLSLPAFLPAPSTSQTLSNSKQYATSGSRTRLNFTFGSALLPNQRLTLTFPRLYPVGLGAVSCFDSLGSPVFCQVSELGRTLVVKYLQGSILFVEGISQPIDYSESQFRFNVDSAGVVLQTGYVPQSTASTILSTTGFPLVEIIAAKSTSDYQGTASVYNIDFVVPAGVSLSTGSVLRLNFRTQYNQTLQTSSLGCSLTAFGQIVEYSGECSVTGAQVRVLLQQPLSAGQYSLSLAVNQPFFYYPFTSQFYLELTSSNQANTLARSFSPNNNYVQPTLTRNSALVYLDWYFGGVLNSVIASYSGLLSSPITLGAAAYGRSFVVTGLGTTVPVVPSFSIGTGPTSVQVQSTLGYYVLTPVVAGDGAYYAQLPPLFLSVQPSTNVPLTLVQSTLSLPLNVVSFVLTVTAPLPSSPTSLSLSMPTTLGISLNTTSVNVSSTFPSAIVGVVINAPSVWSVATGSVTLTVTSSIYSAPATVTVTPAPNIVSVSLSAFVASPSSTDSNISLSGVCSSQGAFIYFLSLNLPSVPDCLASTSQISSFAMGLSSPVTYLDCQLQFGSVPVLSGQPFSKTLAGKYSSNYNLTGFCLSNSGLKSSTQSLSFTSKQNGGGMASLTLTFQSDLTSYQKIQLCCYLALKFKIDFLRVSTYDGYYCSQLTFKRILISKHGSKRILLGNNSLVIYFGNSNGLASDSALSAVAALAANNGIANDLNYNVAGLPTVVSNSGTSLPIVGATSTLTYFIDVGKDFIYGYGLKLNIARGLVYVVIGANWTSNPTATQVRVGQGPGGAVPVYSTVLLYNGTNSSAWFLYQGLLPDTHYQIYLLATDENPFNTANFGGLISMNTTKQIPKGAIFLLMSLAFLTFI